MSQKITLVYIATSSEELYPAVFNLKAYALSRIKDRKIKIETKIIKPTKLKRINNHIYRDIPSRQINSISDSILKKNPVFVGLSTYVWNVDLIFKVIKKLKNKKPFLPIVIGGAEATYNARKILQKNKNIDIVALDEGEETFVDLIRHFLYKKIALTEIKGIAFKKNGRVIQTQMRKPLDLKQMPSPYLTNLIKINKGRETITVETSRGCPFKCAYCSYNMFSYAHLRFFPLSEVIKELIYIIKQKPKKINIVDDNFNIYDLRAKKILNSIIKCNKKILITLFIRADIWPIKKELARLLAKPYFYLTVGVQSLNKKTLFRAKRIHNINSLNQNIKLLRSLKANIILQFIIGLPGDTYKDIKDDINWAFSHQPNDIQIQTLRVNPGTLYEKEAKKYGITYRRKPPYTIFKTNTMSQSELKKSEKIAQLFQMLYRNNTYRKRLSYFCQKTNQPISVLLENLKELNQYNLFFLPKNMVIKIIDSQIRKIYEQPTSLRSGF